MGVQVGSRCSIRFGVLRGAKLRQPSGPLTTIYTYVILLSPALFQICPSFEAIYRVHQHLLLTSFLINNNNKFLVGLCTVY